jgi:hypothetical protein
MRLLNLLKKLEADDLKMEIDSYPWGGLYCVTSNAVEAFEACEQLGLAQITIKGEQLVLNSKEPENWFVYATEGFPHAPRDTGQTVSRQNEHTNSGTGHS